MLRITDVNASYGDLDVLFGVSIAILPGEICCLLGRNGAGKSTLVKALAGILHPMRGHIELNGERIDRLEPHKVCEKGLSVVLERRRLFKAMTIKENLQLGAFRRQARKNANANMSFVLDLFPGLEKRMKQPAGLLSGGEQQMVAIGRALMSDPQCLVLDEPLLGLSPLVVSELLSAIRLISQSGRTIFFVEQNVEVALRLAERAYVLDVGRIVLEGKSNDLAQNARVKHIYLGIKEVSENCSGQPSLEAP